MSPTILGEATYHQRLVSTDANHQYPHSNCHVGTYLNHGVSHFLTHLKITDLQTGSDADGIRLHEVAPFLQHCHGQKPLARAIARHHGHVDADLTMPHSGRLRKTSDTSDSSDIANMYIMFHILLVLLQCCWYLPELCIGSTFKLIHLIVVSRMPL